MALQSNADLPLLNGLLLVIFFYFVDRASRYKFL